MKGRAVAVALVHHPVLGRGGEVITATMTNLDVHDLSRAARTFGLDALFVVHPVAAQRLLGERIQRHWVGGSGGRRIPDRATALEIVSFVPLLADALAHLGDGAELWVTAARAHPGVTASFAEARALLDAPGPGVLLCFGTAWGLAPSIVSAAHRRLEPIRGASDYNHLSVRAAVAITLDRLFGER